MKQMLVISAVVMVLVLFLEVGVALPNTPTESHHEIRPLPSTFHQGNTSDDFPQRLHPNKDHHSELLPKSASSEGGHGGEGGEGSNERYPLAVIDFARVQTPFIIGLWIFCACLGKIGFHMTPKLSHVFPESCMLVVLGIIIGLLLFYTQAASVSPLTADVFFLYLLPPIILDAGYFMPNRLFFDHLFTILVFAVIGTIWNAMTIGISMYAISLTGLFGVEIPVLHMFLFSSLISAVDPVAVLAVFEEIHVEEVLYILVFGESLLNDGVTVVLYHLFEGFSELGEENLKAIDIASGIGSFLLVALGGTAIGIIWGFLTAFVTRFTSQVRVIEPIFVFVMSYLAYLNAEIFHFSGILSITFCGITMKNYVEQNISNKSHTTIKYAMKMLASSAETVIFMFLGVSTVQSKHEWNTWFVILTILFCSIYRIFGVLIFSTICNRFRVKKISFVDKFVMSYGGLRGAVAFALVITIDPHHIPLQPMFLTATIAMVYFTVFVQGITIKPLVQLLGVKRAEKRTLTMNERLHERTMDYILAGVEDVMGKHGNLRLRNKFKRFNNKYLTAFLVREKNVIEPKFLETYSNIKMKEAMAYMSSDGGTQQIESFTQLLRNAVTHPHVIKNNHGEWNLDVGELEYNPTQRDINDAKYHHLLSNDYKPVKRHRGSTYKRHAVKEDEMHTPTDITHHHMQFYTRQLASKVNKLNKKGKKPGSGGDATIPEHPSAEQNNKLGNKTEEELRAAFQQNGSAIKLKSDQLALMMRDNPAFEDDDGVIGSTKPGEALVSSKRRSTKGPTMAETALPWKRYHENGTPTNNKILQRSLTLLPDNGESSQPTVAESVLPWKRPEAEEVCDRPLKQSEFPPWASNKEYVNYYSPSNTFIGGIGKHESYPNIREIFAKRTYSNASLVGSRRGSLRDNPLGHKEGSRQGSRRGSLNENPLGHKDGSRRGSLNENSHKERTSSSSSLGDVHNYSQDNNADHPENTNNPHQYFVRQRSSTGDGSLLNTIIKEEGQPFDTVIIEMSPGGTNDENTRM